MTTLQEILADLKSLEVLEGEAVAKRIRERAAGGSSYPVKDLEDGRVELFRRTPTGEIAKDVLGVDVEEAQILASRRGVKWRDVYAERIKRQWGSDERVDRHGDIVLQNWDFTDFAKNPAMPFNHEWDGLPVGVHLDWAVVNRVSKGYSGRALLLTSLYAAADEMPPAWGDSLFRLVDAGMLRANSVGFIPGKIILVQDEEERERLGLGRWGDILDENLLLENSPTLLGANQGAMTILNCARGSGRLQAADMHLLRELNRQAKHDDADAWVEEDDLFVKMSRLLFPTEEFTKAQDVDEPLFTQDSETEPESKGVEDDSLVIEVKDAEEKEAGNDLLLAKIQQLIQLVEMMGLSLQTQLDGLADALLDGEGDVTELSAAKEQAIKLIRSVHSLPSDLETEPEEPLEAYLARLVHSS